METCKECGGELPHCDCQDVTSVFYIPRLELDYVCSRAGCYNLAQKDADTCKECSERDLTA